MSIISLVLVVVAVSLLAADIQAQNNGDIRLVNEVNMDAFQGRLEIFIDGEWGTICGNSDTANLKAVANIACRQLGSNNASLYGTATQLGLDVAPASTPVHFGSIDCGSSNSENICSDNYYEHVLRCAVDENVDTTTCTHANDIVVACSTNDFTSNVYEGQVFIYDYLESGNRSLNVSLSMGVLGISFFNTSGLVCDVDLNFDRHAADTACRQLGYTNAARNFRISFPTEDNQIFWNARFNCNDQSHSCLRNCFTEMPRDQRMSCSNMVFISCEYDHLYTMAPGTRSKSSGSPRMCDAEVADKCEQNGTSSTAMKVGITVILAFVAACTMSVTSLV